MEFKTIDFAPRYKISKSGIVKGIHGKYLKPRLTKDGYHRVGIWKKGDKKATDFYIHKLVCMVFLDHTADDGKEVHHIDNDKSNNCISNLRLVSHTENMLAMKKDKLPLYITRFLANKGSHREFNYYMVKTPYNIRNPRYFRNIEEAIEFKNNKIESNE